MKINNLRLHFFGLSSVADIKYYFFYNIDNQSPTNWRKRRVRIFECGFLYPVACCKCCSGNTAFPQKKTGNPESNMAAVEP